MPKSNSLATEVVAAFDCRYMLGLSATAFRREDGMTRLIHFAMGDRVHQVDGRMLAASGAVVRPELDQRPTEFSYGFQGEYSRLLKALAEDRPRNQRIVEDIRQLLAPGHEGTVLVVSDRVGHCETLADLLAASGVQVAVLTGRTAAEERTRIVLVVSDRVAHCQALAAMLAEQAVEAAVLTGQTPPESRGRIVEEVRAGRVPVLVATLQLIGEGFDCPGLSTLVLATPIKFEGRLLQVVGRIMRPAEGKRARVIDYVDERIPVLCRSAATRRAVFSGW